MSYHDVVIVGAGHAGAQAAIFLRQLGFAGSIVLVGNEAHLPYERPPLSKEYFAGERSFERILIRPADFWKDRSVDIDLGREVTHVDPVAKSVRAGDRVYHYDKLIWATGGTPRNLTCDGALASNVHSIRRRDDIDAIMAKMDQIDHVTIIGGGYIGLEAAAVFRKFGKDVVLLEALDRVLSRVAGQALSEVYQAEHRAHGVDLRTEVRVDCIETRDDAAVAVILGNGDRISTDIVIVGVGIEPSIGPLASASVAVNNGVEVDRFCQTSLPDVYAIGDCASHINEFAGGARVRLESVQNANDQAKIVAGHILGRLDEYDSVPWFWSNQYDLKLQTVGLSTGHDHCVVRGDPLTRSFSVLYLKDGRLIAIDSVNAVKDYVQAKALILSKAIIDAVLLADIEVPLKAHCR